MNNTELNYERLLHEAGKLVNDLSPKFRVVKKFPD